MFNGKTPFIILYHKAKKKIKENNKCFLSMTQAKKGWVGR